MPTRDVRLTQLAVPAEIKQRVEAQAALDRRTYKLELMVLIEEALAAREKKQARDQG